MKRFAYKKYVKRSYISYDIVFIKDINKYFSFSHYPYFNVYEKYIYFKPCKDRALALKGFRVKEKLLVPLILYKL